MSALPPPSLTLTEASPITQIVRHAKGWFTTQDLADLLQVDCHVITASRDRGELEWQHIRGRNIGPNYKKARVVIYEKIAVLRWLWKNRHGDGCAFLSALEDAGVKPETIARITGPDLRAAHIVNRTRMPRNVVPICPASGALVQTDLFDPCGHQPPSPALLPKPAEKGAA